MIATKVDGIKVEYLTCAETAKLVRAALKRAYPTTKFSVRSETYSMGASIHIGWTDGPTVKMVDEVVQQFRGSDFDGMIDLAVDREHYLLPDGTATLAHTCGTVGSGGVLPGERHYSPSPTARRVSFGADHIFCSRGRPGAGRARSRRNWTRATPGAPERPVQSVPADRPAPVPRSSR